MDFEWNPLYRVHTFNTLGFIYIYPDPVYKEFILKSKDSTKPESHTFDELVDNSDRIKLKFPNERCRIRNQFGNSRRLIEEEASTVYPYIHEIVFVLYCEFLGHKMKYGTEIEKNIYNGMTIEDFVERLLVKRCVSFYGKKNRYLLRSGEIGNGNFKTIGTDKEQPPLVMRDYLTLDEIKLASFICISSCSQNKITIGICGIQLDKKGLMDYQDIILGKSQNCKENGYGPKPKEIVSDELEESFHKRSIWNNFYSIKSVIYGQIDRKKLRGSTYRSPKVLKRYVKIENATEFYDCDALEKRYSSILSMILIESNARAKKLGKMAYIWINRNLMGLESMQEWQEDYFFRMFVSVSISLFRQLYSVFCIHLENFPENCWVKDDTLLNNNNEDDPYFWNKHPNKGIKIRLSSERVKKEAFQDDDNFVYISTYSASPNSFPGNEFWMRKISSNKESTAYLACHSYISELHNPLVNSNMVSGKNLHIASEYGGVVHISEYCSLELENRYKTYPENVPESES